MSAPVPGTLRALVLVAALAPSPLVAGDEATDALQREVRELRERVRALESQLAEVLKRLDRAEAKTESHEESVAVTEPEPVAISPAEPERGRVGMGGRVKVDALASSRSTGGPGGANRFDTAFLPGALPLNSRGEKHQLTASARDSRFWFDAVSPTEYGDLSAYVEIDFVSSDGSGNERVSNSYNPRLRHAYGTFGNFTAGQTYTTFLNTLSYPELNDALGPIGILNVRQPLLRYERTRDVMRWSFALEQPETVVRDAGGTRFAADDDRFPDTIARVDVDNDRGHWSVAAMLRELRVDHLSVPGSDRSLAGALSASGRIYTGSVDNVRFALTWGEGVGRYVSFNAFDDAALLADGSLEPISVWSGFAAYQHWWSDRLRSNWAVGIAEADIDPALLPGTTNEAFLSSHLNLLWSPIPEATIGIEWLYGERRLANGTQGSFNRFQVTSLYKFKR